MSEWLTIVAGPDSGRFLELEDRAIVFIGRGENCALRLSDPSASRLHCRLIVSERRVVLEDAGSRWGTLVNGVPVETRELRPGDRIAIGDTELQFDVSAAGDETAEPRRPRILTNGAAGDSPRTPLRGAAIEQLAGERFLRFRVGAIIARSHSGIVFRALDTRYDRPVALKIFRPEFFEDERGTRRFLRAVRTMLPLEHPNLVKLHSAGRTQGLCFMVSEFIDGESVAEMIRRIGIAGMLDWRRAWEVAIGVTRALAFAHARSIIHRNLSPSNILVRQRDRQVKLGDLMLAKALDEIGTNQVTRPGEVVGDVHYLSPEQLAGDEPVDSRADLWSLGATMYAILTGRPPFEGKNAADVIGQICTRDPEPPTRHHLAIPAGLEGIVLRLLSRRPADRFATAEQLLADLERFGRYNALTDLAAS